MGGIGGLNAFIKPVLSAAVPYFVIYFLYSLSRILWLRYEQGFHSEAIQFLEYSKTLLYRRVKDHNSKEFKSVIQDIKNFIDHEVYETVKLGDSSFKEDESEDK